jgi:hypothetical protein
VTGETPFVVDCEDDRWRKEAFSERPVFARFFTIGCGKRGLSSTAQASPGIDLRVGSCDNGAHGFVCHQSRRLRAVES